MAVTPLEMERAHEEHTGISGTPPDLRLVGDQETENLFFRARDTADPTGELHIPGCVLVPEYRLGLAVISPGRQYAFDAATRLLVPKDKLVRAKVVDKTTATIDNEPFVSDNPDVRLVFNALINMRGYSHVTSIGKERPGLRPLDISQSEIFMPYEDDKAKRANRLREIVEKFEERGFVEMLGSKRGTTYILSPYVTLDFDKNVVDTELGKEVKRIFIKLLNTARATEEAKEEIKRLKTEAKAAEAARLAEARKEAKAKQVAEAEARKILAKAERERQKSAEKQAARLAREQQREAKAQARIATKEEEKRLKAEAKTAEAAEAARLAEEAKRAKQLVYDQIGRAAKVKIKQQEEEQARERAKSMREQQHARWQSMIAQQQSSISPAAKERLENAGRYERRITEEAVPMSDLTEEEENAIQRLLKSQSRSVKVYSDKTIDNLVIKMVCEDVKGVKLPKFTARDRKAFRMAKAAAKAQDVKKPGWQRRLAMIDALEHQIWVVGAEALQEPESDDD